MTTTNAPPPTLSMVPPSADFSDNNDNPYVPSVKLWNDVVGVVLRENALLRWVTIGCGVVILGLVVALCTVSTRQPEIGALVLDKSSQSAKVYSLPSIHTSADIRKQLVAYFLPLFIESLYTVSDLDADTRNVTEFIRPLLKYPSQAAVYAKKYLTEQDPTLRSNRMRVAIEVDPLGDPRKENQYLVGWTATTRNLNGATISKKHYTGLFDVEWGAPQPLNPAGMAIISATVDSEKDVPQAGDTQ